MNTNLWAAQFQNIDVSAIAKSPFGTVVVDAYGQDGSPFTAAQVQQMGGGAADPRLTLGYMSVGEAGNYRTFWKPEWNQSPPSWLGAENPNWPGDYQVRFWNPAWQDLLFAYLDGIVRQGFDGVFLDVVDIYQSAMAERERADPEADMVGLIQDFSAYARALNPGFKIYVNNAEELIANPAYLAAIDGVNKEDLYYGVQGSGIRNAQEMIDWSAGLLKQAQAAGKTVLVAEYVSDAAAIDDVMAMSGRDGFSPYIAKSALSELDYTVADRLGDPSTGSPAEPMLVKGTSGSDILTSGDGDDQLLGYAGQDTLKGGVGQDLLIGGGGRDTLWGGSGADVFAFNRAPESGAASTSRDWIADFGASDRIDLSAIDANTKLKGDQAFRIVGEFTGRAGELEYSEVPASSGGTQYVVTADVNGDARADFSLRLKTVPGLATFDDWAFIL